jgi:hypothetical protein
MLISIIPDVCIVSQLKRCYVSFHELIVSCSSFEEISSIGFLSVIVVLDKVLRA